MIDDAYRKPGELVESNDPNIISFALNAVGEETGELARAVRLYEAVRDQIAYDPYDTFGQPHAYSAKRALERGRGFCIPKAALLAASARALGIPGRIGFADVRNHLASPRLVKANNGDVFRWHAYTELYLNENWVKATPAFDTALCERCGIQPLAFDGLNDSVFQPYDQRQRRHMEYIQDRGAFADVPFELIIATFREHSPGLLDDQFHIKAAPFAAEVTIDPAR